ncbi:hypothetical protein [Actinoplanes palleronii]|uniref:Uncharacterized protein n=1 Tax=Actinoplanes palleronii TaxID=113570 RepID=A0ABQ4BD36_9ACTN|nr:hypothetical protein [Actinoplanes palleronii]GIE68291.1 hypothetical protein Apa02nite_043990 [Actinoplanes palleronii]
MPRPAASNPFPTWPPGAGSSYAQARRLGMITDAGHRRVEQARERAVAFVETRSGPLSQDWSTWQVPAEWPLPSLPPGALDRSAP